MTRQTQLKLVAPVVLCLAFAGLLVANPATFLLAGFFLMALMISLLKNVKSKIGLSLSPIIGYPVILVLFFTVAGILGRFYASLPGGLAWLNVGLSIVFFGPPVIFGLVYAVLFKDALREWIDPSVRWIGFGLACLMVLFSFFASRIELKCVDVSQAEKGVRYQDIAWCQRFTLSHPTDIYLAIGIPFGETFVLLPSAIILVGMAVGYASKRKHHSAS